MNTLTDPTIATDVSVRLVALLKERIDNIWTLDTASACHVLLCARDLRIDSFGLRRRLDRIAADSGTAATEQASLVGVLLRQVVLQRYDIASSDRRDFLARWVGENRFREQDIVTVAWVLGLAAEQLSLVPPSQLEYVRDWFVRHNEITSLRTNAWTPRYLELCGHNRIARERADAILASRGSDKLWPQSPALNVSAAYALSRASCLNPRELQDTAHALLPKLQRGATGADLTYALNALKFLFAVGLVPMGLVSDLAEWASTERTVFLSHASVDRSQALQLAKDLTERGIRVWVDEAEIRPGDSIVSRIEDGIHCSRFVFFLVSATSLKSNWVLEEIRMALHEGVTSGRTRVVPIRLDDSPLPGFLRDKKCVDLCQDRGRGLSQLMTVFNQGDGAS